MAKKAYVMVLKAVIGCWDSLGAWGKGLGWNIRELSSYSIRSQRQ